MANFFYVIKDQIKKAKLRKEDDEVLLERAKNLVKSNKEVAVQILEMIKNPNTKLSGLNELKENFDLEHIARVVNTLQINEKSLLFEQDDIVKEIKKINNMESKSIIRGAIDNTKQPRKRLERLEYCLEELSDYDIISVLNTVEDSIYGDIKLKIISNKIASNYAKFGTSMHIKEFSECISEDLRRLIPSKTAEEFEKLKTKQYDKTVDSYVSIEENIKQLFEREQTRYTEGEIIKGNIDKKNCYTGVYDR